MIEPARTSYSSNEVAHLTGLTLRKLQWLDERKVVSPRRKGHRRVYEMIDVCEIHAIAQLRDKGLPLHIVRRGMPRLRRHVQTYGANGEFLLFNGAGVTAILPTESDVVEHLKHSKLGAFMAIVEFPVRLAPRGRGSR